MSGAKIRGDACVQFGRAGMESGENEEVLDYRKGRLSSYM